MWTLLTLLVLVGVMAYFTFFWSPDEDTVTASGLPPSTKEQTSAAKTPSYATRLESEKMWYGLTFRGYRDDYCLSTTRTINDCAEVVRAFFAGRKAKVSSHDSQHLLLSRGKKFCKYFGIWDTWPPQEIDVSFQSENDVTKMLIQYRVIGWHFRIPPNNLRHEVLKLQTQLVTAKIDRVANTHPLALASATRMQIQAQLTKTDYSKFRNYAMYRLRKVWLLYPIAGLLFAWEIFPKDYAARGVPFAFALLFTLFVGGILSGLVAVVTFFLVKIMPNRPGSVLGLHTFTLTDSEFQEVNAAGSASIKLELLRRHETRQHVFLVTPTHVGHILPMRDLEANPEFLRVLRERTKAA